VTRFANRDSARLSLPPEALTSVAGVTPYLPLLPLITDRHVDAFTLAGTVNEVVEHAIVLLETGVDGSSRDLLPLRAEPSSRRLLRSVRRSGRASSD
jgi:hypothetical protein